MTDCRTMSRMFRSILSLAFIAAVLLVSPTREAEAAATHDPHSFTLGTEISHRTYKEPSVEEDGVMFGVFGDYAYHGPEGSSLGGVMLGADIRASFGEVDYDGQLIGGGKYTIDNIDDYEVEIRGRGGYDIQATDTTRVTPYIGIGYRYLNDDSSFDPAGYERESEYLYSPIGVETLTRLNDNWSLGLTAEYDLFWDGTQTSHLSDVSSAFGDVENDQNDGYGVRGSVTLLRHTERFNFLVEIFGRYWDIDQSNISTLTFSGAAIGGVFEPENDSTEYGVRLGMEF